MEPPEIMVAPNKFVTFIKFVLHLEFFDLFPKLISRVSHQWGRNSVFSDLDQTQQYAQNQLKDGRTKTLKRKKQNKTNKQTNIQTNKKKKKQQQKKH